MSVRRCLRQFSTLWLSAAALACDAGYSPGPFVPEPPEVASDSPLNSLFGSWLAHTITVTAVADAELSRDLVPAGSVFNFRIDLDATYTSLTSLRGGALLRETGTLVITGTTLTLVPDNSFLPTAIYAYRLAAEALELDFQGRFDLDRNGEEEDALFHIKLFLNPISLGTR